MNSAVLIRLSLLFLLSAGSVDAATLREIEARGYMMVGMAAQPSAFGGMADGKPSGFDAALIDDFARSVPFKVRRRPIAAGDIEAALIDGTIDLAASSIEIAPRQQAVAFVGPDAETTRHYLKRKGDHRIATVADLGGRRFGATDSLDVTEMESRLAQAGAKTGDSIDYPTVREAGDLLVARRVDFVVGAIADLEASVRQHPNDLEIGSPVSAKAYAGWAVARNNVALALQVRNFLSVERNTGALAALQQKYLGRSFADMPPARTD